MRVWWLLMVLAACGGDKEDDPSDADADADVDADSDTDSDVDNDVVTTMGLELTTRDGETLVADLYDAGNDKPGILLLHANPEGDWDRKDWPRGFINKLYARSWTVMALDRRGGGKSTGVARDAWDGPKGKFDVEAAVDHLEAEGVTSLVIIGASNGTTTMIDYAIAAPGQSWLEPLAFGYMTGGTYTETNNPMSAVSQVPAIFTYASNENSWSDIQKTGAPTSWAFHEYAVTSGHGTQMFAADPDVEDDLIAFLEDLLP